MANLDDLFSVTAAGVFLHNILRAAGTIVSAKLTRAANDVEAGNVADLEHQAGSALGFVEDHVPAAAKAVDELKAKANAEVAALKKGAADELRALAERVESATGTADATPSAAAPAAHSGA